jgi:hypothetical protein
MRRSKFQEERAVLVLDTMVILAEDPNVHLPIQITIMIPPEIALLVSQAILQGYKNPTELANFVKTHL